MVYIKGIIRLNYDYDYPVREATPIRGRTFHPPLLVVTALALHGLGHGAKAEEETSQ